MLSKKVGTFATFYVVQIFASLYSPLYNKNGGFDNWLKMRNFERTHYFDRRIEYNPCAVIVLHVGNLCSQLLILGWTLNGVAPVGYYGKMVDSAGPDSCGCKGIRSCLICENYGGKQRAEDICHSVLHFNYEPSLELAVRNEDGTEESFHFPGVFLWENFLSEEEERELVRCMDQDAWKESQSGRKKQDFGPKVNFKKQRVRLGNFNGLPALSRNIVHRMSQEPLLQGFQPVEQCNLDYSPQRGSAIDPHLDDSWLWGERLVTVNMLSNTIITMSHEEGLRELRVYVNFPRRSLLVLHSDARHKWKHAIHRKDINQRRVCSTFRELSPAFLSGGEYEHIGSQLLGLAHCFQGSPV